MNSPAKARWVVASDHPDELDEGGAPLGNEYTVEDIKRMNWRMAEQEASLKWHVRDIVRDALLYDPYILETADEHHILEDQRITWDEKGQLVFYLKANSLDDWKARHQVCLGTDITSHGRPQAYSTEVYHDGTQRKKDRA
ncbi:hypothetical protein BGX28_010511, partial [Mortierella sp. GBA30]